MKIEKLNEHQIRCTLTREDLAARHIKLSELAYDSEKTRALFQDMMTQASMDFGFEAEDIPIMVEAIPLSSEKIVLIITKVDSPEELDTRFSEFSHFSDLGEPDNSDEDSDDLLAGIPSELSNILRQLKQEIAAAVEDGEPEPTAETPTDLTCLFTFTDMEAAICLSHAIDPAFRGKSSLYKDPGSGTYALFLHQGVHTTMEFSRIILAASSYLEKEKCVPATEAFYREHAQTILPKKAVSTLAQI
ncbi:MAG: adaptor protein MecA [Lachnospiraceae bacterium]|nr:adaptor protein MecA [Lachnospiraceae bacterium]